MGVDKLLSPVTGLLGGGKSKANTTVIRQPAADAQKSNESVDPNRSEAVAEARRRRLALSRRTGRSALRVDLAGGGGDRQTRSGISIG